MGAHERNAMDQDAKLSGADGKGVEVQVSDGGIRSKEMMASHSTSGDHHGAAGQNETGLGHREADTHELRQTAWF
jgi:hypothetical protein